MSNQNQKHVTRFLAVIEKLVDSGSFVELSALSQCGVTTGFGSADGRLIYVYIQHSPVNAENARKIGELYKAALTMGAPVVGFLDTVGMELSNPSGQHGMDVLAAYGEIFSCMSNASGIIPQISVVIGSCMGVSAFVPMSSDFVFMYSKDSCLFLDSPATLPGLEGKTLGFSDFGGGKAHSSKTGLAHFVYENDKEMYTGLKELLYFLPSNNLDDAPLTMFADNINRMDELADLSGDNISGLITSLADNCKFLEVKKGYASEMITGFISLNGATTGIVAAQGALKVDGCEKACSFVRFCDAFNIPLLTIVSISGGYEYSASEHGEMLKSASKLLHSFSCATVPKVSVIAGNSYGSPLLLLNSKPAGADFVFLWDTVETGIMEKTAAQKVVGLKLDNSAKNASGLFADNIISPSSTRKRVISALEMLASKRLIKNAKKRETL